MNRIYFVKLLLKTSLLISIIIFVLTVVQIKLSSGPKKNLRKRDVDEDPFHGEKMVEIGENNKVGMNIETINDDNDTSLNTHTTDFVMIEELDEYQERKIRNQTFWTSLVKRFWKLKRNNDTADLNSSFSDIFINNPHFSLWSFNTLYKNKNFVSPSNFVDTDRIVPQLVLTLEGYNHKSLKNAKGAGGRIKVPCAHISNRLLHCSFRQLKKIHLADSFNWWNYNEDFSARCPGWGSKCEVVADGNGPLDAVITSGGAFKNSGDLLKRFVFILESPFHSGAAVFKRTNDLMNTFWRESDVVTPYEKWVYYDPDVKRVHQDINYAQGKTKMAAIFVSNCGAANGRMGFVKELQQYVNVDIFGGCGTHSCPRGNARVCFEMLKKDYKFYLSFENSNCRDYITEKFFVNGLNNNVVPIVYGSHPDDYLASAPANSYIHVESFNSTKELGEYMKILDSNDEEYSKYFEWKGTGEFIDTKYICRVCAMVHYSDLVPPPMRERNLAWHEMDLCLMHGVRYWWK